MEKILLPDFLIIGAGKSGTTSLDNYLKQHPQIFISPIKEPNFFAYYNLDKNKLSQDEDSKIHYKNSITQIKDYQNLFSGAKQTQIKGETSNTYLYGELAADNILEIVPNVKLIVILRQPAERLYSRYLHLARDNRLPSVGIEDIFVSKKSIWWHRPDLIKEGFYYKYLSKFYKLFPRENIKIYLFEDLKRDSEGLIKDLFEFLDVDNSFTPNTEVVFNQSGFVKNKLMDRLVGNNSVIFQTIKKIFPSIYLVTKSNSVFQKILNNLRSNNLNRPGMDRLLKEKITNIYRDDIVALQKLINRDLSSWLK